MSWETHIPEMDSLWSTMHIIRDAAELERVEKKIKKYQDVYQKVEGDTGVPWQMVAVIHLREAGEQDIGRWTGVLHNGENIVGTGRKTRLVPKNRGPFSTWHEAAVDALKMEGLTGLTGWTPGKMLAALEPFNGMGYRNKGLRSPYIWASTNHQQLGKYVSDNHFDASVMDTQVGTAAQLKYLGVGNKGTSVPSAGPVIKPAAAKATGIFGILLAAIYSIFQWGADHPFLVGGAILAALFGYLTYKYIKKDKNV